MAGLYCDSQLKLSWPINCPVVECLSAYLQVSCYQISSLSNIHDFTFALIQSIALCKTSKPSLFFSIDIQTLSTIIHFLNKSRHFKTRFPMEMSKKLSPQLDSKVSWGQGPHLSTVCPGWRTGADCVATTICWVNGCLRLIILSFDTIDLII